jgi:hypothetical protein
MNFLRGMFLLLTITAVGLSAQPSFAQQEVDPDHYDQPVARKSAPQKAAPKASAKKQTGGKNTVAKNRAKQHATKPTA